MTYKSCSTMAEVREEIDRLDREIVPLLVERLHFIKEAGRIKQSRDVVRDEWRVEDVVGKCLKTADALNGDVKMVEDVYRHLIEWSINHEFTVWDKEHTS